MLYPTSRQKGSIVGVLPCPLVAQRGAGVLEGDRTRERSLGPNQPHRNLSSEQHQLWATTEQEMNFCRFSHCDVGFTCYSSWHCLFLSMPIQPLPYFLSMPCGLERVCFLFSASAHFLPFRSSDPESSKLPWRPWGLNVVMLAVRPMADWGLLSKCQVQSQCQWVPTGWWSRDLA